MNSLVIGGNRLIGENLALELIKSGHKVTIATRGRTADPFARK